MFSGEAFEPEALGWMANIFIFVVGIFILFLIGVYIADVTQTKQAVRRNYPVIGNFQYYFEHVGTFFRQYFFTMNRKEMPFNRGQRSWVYPAAKDIDNMVAFGSTSDLNPRGTIFFVNTASLMYYQSVKRPLIDYMCSDAELLASISCPQDIK